MRLNWKYFQRWRFILKHNNKLEASTFTLSSEVGAFGKVPSIMPTFLLLHLFRVWLDILCQVRLYKLKFMAGHEKLLYSHEQVSFYCLQGIILCSYCLWACSSGVQDGAYSWWRSHPPCGSYFLWCVPLTNTFAIMYQAFVPVCLWKVSCPLTNY